MTIIIEEGNDYEVLHFRNILGNVIRCCKC